jgi:hypothetical protein
VPYIGGYHPREHLLRDRDAVTDPSRDVAGTVWMRISHALIVSFESQQDSRGKY